MDDVRAPQIEVLALPLPPSIRQKLQISGFRTTEDLQGIQPLDLAQGTFSNCPVVCELVESCGCRSLHGSSLAEAQLTHEEALLALKIALPCGFNSTNGIKGVYSARQILERENETPKIMTFSPDLDAILGKGIAVGQITEFCGVPGIGKTQLGMQLAINVQLPTVFNGLAGEAIYIDTEGSFTPERCAQMAHSFSAHLKKISLARGDPARQEAANALTPDKILSSIHYFRAKDAVEQLAVSNALPSILQERPNVKLIIMDSITFHFRQDFDDVAARTRQLGHMAQSLMAIADEMHVAIVFMNQVTTKIASSNWAQSTSTVDGRGSAMQTRLVPALGDSWAHAATSRVILYWESGVRYAFLYKSPTQPAASAAYAITKDGVRGVKRSVHGGDGSGVKRPHPG